MDKSKKIVMLIRQWFGVDLPQHPAKRENMAQLLRIHENRDVLNTGTLLWLDFAETGRQIKAA